MREPLNEFKRRYAKSVDTGQHNSASGGEDAVGPDLEVLRSKVAELAETLEKKRERAPQVPLLVANDITPEALGTILASTPPALMAAAEGV